MGPTTNEINVVLRLVAAAPGSHEQKLEQMRATRKRMLKKLRPHMRLRKMRITDKGKLKNDPSKRTQPVYYKSAAIQAAWKAEKQALKSRNPLLVKPADTAFMKLDILEKVIEAYDMILANARARRQSVR